MAGVSRSPTIIMAYLIKYNGKTAEEAIKYTQEKRPKVNNKSFHKYLRDYEKYLNSAKSQPK